MFVTFELHAHHSKKELENDLLDAVEFLGSIRGRQYQNDGRLHSAYRLVSSLLEDYRRQNWPQVYILASKEPEKHEADCECGHCYLSFWGKTLGGSHTKRLLYWACIYSLDDRALGQRNYTKLQHYLETGNAVETFTGERYEDALHAAKIHCEESHWYLYDPVAHGAQIV